MFDKIMAAYFNEVSVPDPPPPPPPPERWCTCVGGSRGYRDAGDGLWVHDQCGKPTRMFLEAYEGKKR